MSMWDWDEQEEPYPPEERQQHHAPYASHSGSSDYHGAHQPCSDPSHHHNHVDHSLDQHHGRHDNAHSYHGQQFAGASPSPLNYVAQRESYGNPGSRQNYGYESAGDDQGRPYDSYENQENSYGRSPYASNMATAPPASGQSHEASNPTDLFTSNSVVNLTLDEIDALARIRRSRSWLVVLYAPWCRFCQAMESSFERVAQHLENSNVYVGKFQADGDYKEYAKRYLQLEHFPTVLFFPKDTSNIIKYQSQNREVDALLEFVQAYK